MDTLISPQAWRDLPRACFLLGCVLAITFAASQAHAIARPASLAKNDCPEVAPCPSVCGDVGSVTRPVPNGEALCDCCAPE